VIRETNTQTNHYKSDGRRYIYTYSIHPIPDMTSIVSYDYPSSWASYAHLYDYFVVAGSAAVVYDWALTFGQEFELILVSKFLYQKTKQDNAMDSWQSQQHS